MDNNSDNKLISKSGMGRNKMFDPSARPILERLNKAIDNYYLEYSTPLQVGRNDKNFLFVDMWSPEERASFNALNKPLLTYNNLISYFRKIVGQQRFNTSSLEVGSINGTASQEAVTLRADLIRGIEYESRAQECYQQGFEDALSAGMGFIRVKADYESPRSFNQKISIEWENRPDRVFFDPTAKTPTKTDGEYMGRHYDMSRTEFERAYPDIPYPRSFPVLGNYYTDNFTWGNKDTITICEFYEKKWISFTVYLLSDGREVTKKEYKKIKEEFEESLLEGTEVGGNAPDGGENEIEGQAQPSEDNSSPSELGAPNNAEPNMPQPMPPQPISPGIPVLPQIVKSRKTREYKIMCYKCIYGHVLEKYEMPGDQFPLAAVMGDEKIIAGRRIVTSFVTYAKDPQRVLNLIISDTAQSVKNNRKERLMATPANIEGFEQIYANPENVYGALLYNKDEGTPPIPLPTPEVGNSMLGLISQSQRDIKTIVGVMLDSEDRSYGQLTGRALREMIRDGNSANLIFFDNLRRAQEQIGRTILSMVPDVYDTHRDLVIKTADGKIKKVTVNKPIANGIHNDLSGKGYDVSITAGPQFTVQKEEAFQSLLSLVQTIPGAPQLAADIMAKNIDIEDSIELVNRFKTLVPPNAILMSGGDLTPQQQQMMQQQNQQQQQMAQQAQQAQQLSQQLAQSKAETEAAKAHAAEVEASASLADAQTKGELNQVKLTQAVIDTELAKIRAYAEASNADLNYKSNIAQSIAKITQAHADISQKHFETLTQIHGLQQAPLVHVTNVHAEQPKEQ